MDTSSLSPVSVPEGIPVNRLRKHGMSTNKAVKVFQLKNFQTVNWNNGRVKISPRAQRSLFTL